MAGKQSLYDKQLERIAKTVGPDLIAFLDEDKLLERMPPEVQMRGLGLDVETLEKLKQLINGQDKASS